MLSDLSCIATPRLWERVTVTRRSVLERPAHLLPGLERAVLAQVLHAHAVVAQAVVGAQLLVLLAVELGEAPLARGEQLPRDGAGLVPPDSDGSVVWVYGPRVCLLRTVSFDWEIWVGNDTLASTIFHSFPKLKDSSTLLDGG